jgi:hypothetical protein
VKRVTETVDLAGLPGSGGDDVAEQDLAVGWTKRVAAELDVPPMSAGDIETVLGLAGDVAHGTGQRSWAPLTAFLAGLYAAQYEDGERALQAVRDVVGGLLNEQVPGSDLSGSAGAESERRQVDG